MKDLENRFQILPGLPHSKEPVHTFGGQPSYSEGFIVRFFKKDGDSWIGNFRSNRSKLNTVEEGGKNDEVYVFAEGSAYLLNTETAEILDTLGEGFEEVLKTPDNTLILSDGCKITVINPHHQPWESERIAWNEIKELRLQGDILRGLAYDAMDTKQEWKPFSLNLTTKEVRGGSYANYLPEKSSQKITITLKEINALFKDVLSSKKSREEVANQAVNLMQAKNAGNLVYQPATDEDKIWSLITYLSGIDLKDAPGTYLHHKDDLEHG